MNAEDALIAETIGGIRLGILAPDASLSIPKMLRDLGKFFFTRYSASAPKLIGETDVMSSGSSNVLVTGTGKTDIFKGVTVKNSVVGAKVLMNSGDGYGGLGGYNETGIGSVFRVLGALFYIGAGKLYYNGVYQSASASTTLSLKKFVSGILGTVYQVGLAQPSAASIRAITPPSGYTGKNTGTVSIKIARVRSATGARSIASLTSNVVQASALSVAVTFPLPDANGQDYWEVDATLNGQGGIGNHYFLQEIPETTIAQTVAITSVTSNGTVTISVPNAQITTPYLGWQIAVSGEATTPYITAIGADDSDTTGRRTVTLSTALANTASGLTATITRAIDGVTRTYVFEWRDADLAGADLAPTRDYPPPAGVFASSSRDVVFVDGCYGDTVNVTNQTDAQTGNAYSSATAGNAIAVSDPNRPESFPPDNYIFTGDAPTALVVGSNGVHWRFGQNSLGVVRYVGGSPAVSYEKLWTGIGVRNQNNVVLGSGGRPYAFTGGRGLTRLGTDGEPDTIFATDIMDDIKDLDAATTVLGYDGNHQYVVVMNGGTIWAFYEAKESWTTPLYTNIEGQIVSSVTINGAMYIAIKKGSVINLYDFNIGTGSDAVVKTAWIPSAEVSTVVSRLMIALRVDSTADVTINVYTNGDEEEPKRTMTYSPGDEDINFQILPVFRPNVRNAKTYKLEILMTGAGQDSGFEGIEVQGQSQNITW